jgi:GABA permease
VVQKLNDDAGAPTLGRTLGQRHIAMISIGGIIGAGLFVGSSAAIVAVGPAIIVSYLIAGLIVLCVMRMLGEMAASNPQITSFTEFARAGLGDWAGFTAGWLYWYFWVVVVAIEAIAGAVILKQWLPFEVWQIGLVLMLVMTAVNLLSTRSYGEFEFWFASLKVGAILAFIAIGAGYLLGFAPPQVRSFENLYQYDGFAPLGIAAILAGVVTVIFALTGAEIATIAAAESKEPGKAVARLTGSVAARILLFYVVSIFLIVTIVPWTEIVPGVSPFAVALERVGIPGVALAMQVIVLTAVLSCLNSGLYVTSRVLFVLATRGDAPQALIALNKRKVPERAILIGSVFGYGAVVASILSPQVVFAFLVNASGATMIMIYLMIAVAHIRLRNKADPASLSIKMWLFPALSYATILAMAGVLGAMTTTPELFVQLACSAFAFVVSLAFYVLVRKRSARVLAANTGG